MNKHVFSLIFLVNQLISSTNDSVYKGKKVAKKDDFRHKNHLLSLVGKKESKIR